MTLEEIAQLFNPFPKAEAAFFGEKSQTADKDLLEQAKQMQGVGRDRQDIWDETGWFKAPDGSWQYEVPEPPGIFDSLPEQHNKGEMISPGKTLKDVMNFPAMREAYPDIDPQLLYTSLKGSEYEGDKRFGQARYMPDSDPTMSLLQVVAPSIEAAEKDILHESQHAIQNREGAPGFGASPESFKKRKLTPELKKYLTGKVTEMSQNGGMKGATIEDLVKHALYELSPGEAMARNAANRMPLGQNRKATPPWETFDVPESLLFTEDLLHD